MPLEFRWLNGGVHFLRKHLSTWRLWGQSRFPAKYKKRVLRDLDPWFSMSREGRKKQNGREAQHSSTNEGAIFRPKLNKRFECSATGYFSNMTTKVYKHRHNRKGRRHGRKGFDATEMQLDDMSMATSHFRTVIKMRVIWLYYLHTPHCVIFLKSPKSP